MDTRSKNWKAAVSFIAFLLGSLLLLASIPLGVAGVINWNLWSGALQSDYQNSWQFKEHMSNALRVLLDLATENSKWATVDFNLGDPYLLYEVRVDGKLIYRTENTPDLGKGAPEGYNFYVHFADHKVTAEKDGKSLDVYGVGNTTSRPPWDNLDPRYIGQRDVEINMAAPAKLAVSYNERYDGLASVQTLLNQTRTFVLRVCIVPAAGLLLFLLYIILRKDKKRADMAVARGTGRMWAEFKVLILLVPVFFELAFFCNMLGRNSLVYNCAYFVMPPVFLVLCYLAINDLRYNSWHHTLRQSGCGALLSAWHCEELKHPVEKRLQRRAVAVFVAMLPFALVSIWWGRVDLLPWAWDGSTDRQGMFIAVPLTILGLICLLAEIYFLRQGIADAHLVNEGMEDVIAERMRSERMKVELIANVSHDLKTPLTSIISYTELLSREELNEQLADYVKILSEKAERLKTMVQEVFEVSKAASGDLPLNLETLDLCKLIRQTIADMAEPIEASGLTLREQIFAGAVPILADGNRMYRVFQNLIQNALKYSLEGSRVYVTVAERDGWAVASVQNTSKDELRTGVDFTERFVRGDESRTDGGSGLGLSIARTFTEACGGRFKVAVSADLFTATVEFPLGT